ncbi:MAG: SDR family NAD(P)-dependent oxidoreductase [Gemmatimonadetes bacterium]|nr:SDR family NAD(P)-dependent oxidoreductase [Gemmatimonadota bacterium]
MPELFRDTTVLITGASRGIGAAFARLLAARGARLLLVARHAADLEAVAAAARQLGARADILPCDLADPAIPARLAGQLEARGLVVDHLINNAGVGPQGRFADLPVERHLPVIDVNIRAVTELTGRLLPGMIARRRGGVLNVASTAAWQGLMWLPVYSASKAFVVTWSEAVWVSLRGSGVRCCCVSPGPVDTPFFDANDLTARPPAWLMQSAETVAERALRAYARDDCHLLPFLPFRLAAWSTRLVPRALAARFGARYAAPPR